MAGNPSYQVSDFTAFAIEQQLERDWNDNICKDHPVIAAIHDRGTGWNKGFSVDNAGTGLLVPLRYALTAGVTTSNIGVASANEVPAGWPTYPTPGGFTHAKYTMAHLFKAIAITESEKVRGGGNGGQRGALLEGKVDQLMDTFKEMISQFLAGSAADGEAAVMGLDYAIATGNTVGGIDQSAETWWRANVKTGTGTFSLPVIDDAMDLIAQNGTNKKVGKADLLLLGYNVGGGGVNCYGKVRSQIAPAERIVNANFEAKYGFENFNYRGAMCVQDNRAPANTSRLLTTGTWLWGGPKRPKRQNPVRILGSDAEDWGFTLWCFLGCRENRRNFRWTGITG